MIEERMEKILFLGNSITHHPLVSYWWGEWGMAADSRDRGWCLFGEVAEVIEENFLGR